MKPTLERAPTRLLLVESNPEDAELILEMLEGATGRYFFARKAGARAPSPPPS